MALAQIEYGVERGLNRAAGRPFLDDRLRDLVALAKLVDQTLGLCVRRIGLKEALVAIEDIVDASPARVDDHGCRDAIARSHRAENEGLLHVFGVALPSAIAAARLLRSIVDQP